jgi:hypothetical protein
MHMRGGTAPEQFFGPLAVARNLLGGAATVVIDLEDNLAIVGQFGIILDDNLDARLRENAPGGRDESREEWFDPFFNREVAYIGRDSRQW